MMSKNKPKKFLATFVVALMLVFLFCNVSRMNPLDIVMASSQTESATSEDLFGRSDVAVSAYANATFVPRNNSIDLTLSSLIRPTEVTLDTVRGFEPEQRFNSQFSIASEHASNSGNSSLESTNNGLRLSFDAISTYEASISVYKLSFTNRVNVSREDFLSIALSTESDYNSAEGYIGIALSLKDQQNSTHYVYIHVSDSFRQDSYRLSQWFLGSSKYVNQYPSYEIKYQSSFGPWFIQLSLLQAFSSLNLSSAWLESLLIGAELYVYPLPYNMAHADVVFPYAFVHSQPFSINQNVINSTQTTLPSERFLNISGIPCKALSAVMRGPLEPTYRKEEEQENTTVKAVEVFYNFSQGLSYNFSEATINEFRSDAKVNITLWSKSVRKCTITLNNNTIVDLTDLLLRSDQGLTYSFLSDTRTLKVSLILYKFNAWIFDLQHTTLLGPTKKGISEEYFVPENNESVTIVDLNEAGLQKADIAIRAGNFSLSEISINGVKKPLDSLLVVRKDIILVKSVEAEEGVSLYTVRCTFSSNPLHYSPTVQPFSIFVGNARFEIYTPLKIDAQLGLQIPVTIRVLTTKTYLLKVEYDSSMLEVDNDELMVNKPVVGFVYFMLKPAGTGLSVVTVHFIDPSNENSPVSIPFLINTTSSLAYQSILSVLTVVTVLSLMYVAGGKNLLDWLLCRLRLKKGS